MSNAPRPTDLAKSAGISVSYASEILSGVRVPAKLTAIDIFRATGWRHPSIERLTDGEIDVIERALRPDTHPDSREVA